MAIFHMFLAVFFFALMNVGVKLIPHIPAHEVVLFRSIVALAMSIGILTYRKQFTWGNRKDLLILRGVFGSAALFMFFITVQNMPLASAVTIQYLSTVFTGLLGIWMLGERMSPVQWVFYIIAFSGVVLIKGFDPRISTGYLVLGIASSLFSGFAYTTIRRMKDSDHPLVVVMYFPLVALPVSIVWSLFDWVTPHGTEWLILLLTGIAAQLGQIFMTLSLVKEKANIVSSINYFGAIFGLAFSYLLFDESFTWPALLGIGLVVMGVMGNLVRR